MSNACMKFALVNGEPLEAQPGLSGECPACSHPMVAKCGEFRIRHWAHRGGRRCDPWWEPESEWHRNWKNQFPDAWQEVIHLAPNGAKHIADVKTEHGWVIEFQHSHLEHEERRSRDAFYANWSGWLTPRGARPMRRGLRKRGTMAWRSLPLYSGCSSRTARCSVSGQVARRRSSSTSADRNLVGFCRIEGMRPRT
jgi:hypothetical protein